MARDDGSWRSDRRGSRDGGEPSPPRAGYAPAGGARPRSPPPPPRSASTYRPGVPPRSLSRSPPPYAPRRRPPLSPPSRAWGDDRYPDRARAPAYDRDADRGRAYDRDLDRGRPPAYDRGWDRGRPRDDRPRWEPRPRRDFSREGRPPPEPYEPPARRPPEPYEPPARRPPEPYEAPSRRPPEPYDAPEPPPTRAPPPRGPPAPRAPSRLAVAHPEPEPEPRRPELALPVKVRSGPRPGTLARRARARPPPLAERVFYGCSPLEEYDLTVKLGQGTFGEVKKGEQKSTGRKVALKKVTIYEVKDGMPITALREIKLLKMLQHPHIVPVIDMAYRPAAERGQLGEVYMVEPYMDHDLNGLLDNPHVQLQMNQIKLYMRQLLEGTLFMHKNNILHRDMKAANLLIDNEGQLQIADFGLARPYLDPGRAWQPGGWRGGAVNYTDMVVTRWYRPPELLAGQRNYGPPIDMWGVGCILAEMVTGRPIFKGASEIHQLELIAALCGSPNDDNFPGWSTLPGVKNAGPSGRPENNPAVQGRHDFGRHPRVIKQHFTSVVDVGRECADLIDKLLMLDPCKRLTAAEALEHPWFWTKPYPADPASLPKYLPSKEIDRNKRDWKMPGARVHQAPMPGAPGLPPGRPPIPPHATGVPPPGPMPSRAPPHPPPPMQGGATSAYPPMPRLALGGGAGGGQYGGAGSGWYKPSGNSGFGNTRPPPRDNQGRPPPPRYY